MDMDRDQAFCRDWPLRLFACRSSLLPSGCVRRTGIAVGLVLTRPTMSKTECAIACKLGIQRSKMACSCVEQANRNPRVGARLEGMQVRLGILRRPVYDYRYEMRSLGGGLLPKWFPLIATNVFSLTLHHLVSTTHLLFRERYAEVCRHSSLNNKV